MILARLSDSLQSIEILRRPGHLDEQTVLGRFWEDTVSIPRLDWVVNVGRGMGSPADVKSIVRVNVRAVSFLSDGISQ
jgi:hypothetical protein